MTAFALGAVSPIAVSAMLNTASLSSGRASRTTTGRRDILPRFGADRGDDAVELGLQLGVVELVAGQVESGPGGGKLGLGGAQIAQRDVVVRLRRAAVLQEPAEPILAALRTRPARPLRPSTSASAERRRFW